MEKYFESSPEEIKERIKNHIYLCDAPEKSLTGRTPEIIEEETGFKKEDIFPENKQILYVGDPWQRIGREINDCRLKIIDYEFGETASFVENEENFSWEIYDGYTCVMTEDDVKEDGYDAYTLKIKMNENK